MQAGAGLQNGVESHSREDDMRDAESLYQLLEEQVVPAYYERDASGVPRRWVGMMKRAIETLVPAFNSDRMVQEYAQKIYTGAAESEAAKTLPVPVGV
jgi:starch phosphorylase